ncbi:unnamed protein product [Natator depressus]
MHGALEGALEMGPKLSPPTKEALNQRLPARQGDPPPRTPAAPSPFPTLLRRFWVPGQSSDGGRVSPQVLATDEEPPPDAAALPDRRVLKAGAAARHCAGPTEREPPSLPWGLLQCPRARVAPVLSQHEQPSAASSCTGATCCHGVWGSPGPAPLFLGFTETLSQPVKQKVYWTTGAQSKTELVGTPRTPQ